MFNSHEMESIKSPTRKIRTQLEILLHSKKCIAQPCDVANCGEFKSVLLHMNTCKEGRACQGVHCASSTQILKHWDTCQNESCILCLPIRDNTKLNEKYNTETSRPVRTTEPPPFQSWMRKETHTELTPPELRYQRQPSERKRTVGEMTKESKTSDSGFYGNGARTDNLSDEMKLSIREAVQTAMNNMIPQLETMVRTAIRSEIANLLLGQGPEKMLQSPKPYLTSPLHYSTTPTPFPTAPNQNTQYPPTPSQSTQYPSPSSQTSEYPPSQSPQFTARSQGPNFEQKDQVTNPMPPLNPMSPLSKPVTPVPPQLPYPPQELTMTPPSQQALTMTPPSQQVMLSSPSSQKHQVPSPLFTAPQQNMAPPSSALNMITANQHSPGGQTLHTMTPASQHGITMTPASQHGITMTPASQHGIPSPAPSLTLTSPSPARPSEHLYSQASTASPLDSQHAMTSLDEITSRQSLTSQLMAPSPQQQFSDQSGDQFMSMQSELHSYF